MVTSTLIQGTPTETRHARLYACALSEVARLEAAQAAGWDVAADLSRERARVKAFAPKTNASLTDSR
jgi:hypothetical protein